MPVVHTTRPGIIWIPPPTHTVYKLTVERSDGTIDDISELISSAEVEDGVTGNIGKFSFTLWNPNETYTNVWDGNEIFRYYKDYASEATTLRFRGRTEKVSKRENKIVVTGRSESLKLMNITVTKQYLDVECSLILKDLVSSYGTGFTTNNVNVSSESLTVNWYQKPFWDCVAELCQAAGFECRIDSDLDFNFFQSGSRLNLAEGIVHDFNLVEIGDFANDLSLIRNRIIVYGAQQGGIQAIYTAEDTASQVTYGVKEEIINDDNITDYTQVKEYANFLLANKKDPPVVGDAKCILLSSIQPGESIKISSPANGIHPSDYKIISYKDELKIEGGGVFTTTVKINKESKTVSHIFKKIIEDANKSKDVSANLYEMRFSYPFTFDTDSGTHFNTEITNGVLKLQSGQTSGYWISPVLTLASNITRCFPIAIGNTLTAMQFEVSGVGGDGNIWETLSYNTRQDMASNNQGRKLRLRITIGSTSTQVDSISLMFKTN